MHVLCTKGMADAEIRTSRRRALIFVCAQLTLAFYHITQIFSCDRIRLVKNTEISLLLASQSPRRRELLSFIGIPFNVASADVDAIGRACQQAEIVETHYPDSAGFVTPHEFQFNFEHRGDLEELRDAVNRIRKAFERDDCNSEV